MRKPVCVTVKLASVGITMKLSALGQVSLSGQYIHNNNIVEAHCYGFI